MSGDKKYIHFTPVKCPEDCIYKRPASGCGFLLVTGELRGDTGPGPECKKYSTDHSLLPPNAAELLR